jgi:hypothetical protein
MFCENCGTQLPDDSAFCPECGNKILLVENESGIDEENIDTNDEYGYREERGSVPPVMRQTKPRHPSEPYRSEASPRRPQEPYRRESTPQEPSESYIGASADIIGVGQYILMVFLAWIPIVNIILLVKWGFFNKEKPNKSNFAKALLFYNVLALIFYVFYIRLWLSVTSGI